MNRFFVNPIDVDQNVITISNKDDIKHIIKVLRLSIKDRLEISDSNEFEYIGEIDFISQDGINLLIIDKRKFSREPQIKIDLFQGMPKQGKMDYIIQKNVEIGVNKVKPVYTERSVSLEKGNSNNKVERWQKISNEAAKQCKRGILPIVDHPIAFSQMLSELMFYDYIIMPYENETGYTLKNALLIIKEKNKIAGNEKKSKYAIIIGPEGGFAASEVESLITIGAYIVSLGKTILRTETAGTAAIAMMMYELEL